ncbi:MAG: hypothetical protein JWM02_1745 [Frankiales bacterium]|nr:hypothetical protein [Frankiales bacterium]
MTPADVLLVGGAGVVAGAVNAIAGGGTLVSFPALLAAGLSPVTANITSSVGLLAGYVGGTVGYRRELEGQGGRVVGLLVASVIGGLVGALLLLATPGNGFRAVVPYLVLLSCLLLAVQPWLARTLEAHGVAGPHPGWEVRVAVGVGAVYGSYFGAGLGVILLAVLGLLVSDHLQRLNALKGALALVINLVGVLVFVVTGHVAWLAAAVLAVGAVVGATVGVRLARRLSPQVVRLGVVLAGVGVAGTLLVHG